MASARMTKRGGSVVVVVTTILRQKKPHSSIASSCLDGCIIQVPPVVKLRHAKVVVSTQCPRKKPVVACVRPRIALFGVFFRRENSLEKFRRRVDGLLCCCCGP